jgi:signal transduction histidine kinase
VFEVVLVVVLIAGIGIFNRRSLLAVQRLIAEEVKTYLGVILEDHRNESGQLVSQGVQGQLEIVKEELSTALADVVRAEAAQLVAEDAQDMAEVATRAKTDFLSRMSHEIRTPINGIVGSLALLNPQELTVQQAEDLHRAVISSDRLMVVVNEVLDLAQIEADEVEFESVSFDLVEVCDKAENCPLPPHKPPPNQRRQTQTPPHQPRSEPNPTPH